MSKEKKESKNRRLKKAEVKALIDGGAILHEEFTKDYYEKYRNGNEKQDLVYELPNGDFMLVFDPKGVSLAGKANYFTRDSFLKYQRWRKRVTEDYKHKRSSSVDHWRYYSEQGNRLFNYKEVHLRRINKELGIDVKALDFSYKSLGEIDHAIEKYSYGKAWETLYDALVFYVGEVIIKRVDGYWQINSTHYGGDYPFIAVENSPLQYMPINVVWKEVDGVRPCNLRKSTADEVRTNAYLHPRNLKRKN